jgi:hypothetical protein
LVTYSLTFVKAGTNAVIFSTQQEVSAWKKSFIKISFGKGANISEELFTTKLTDTVQWDRFRWPHSFAGFIGIIVINRTVVSCHLIIQFIPTLCFFTCLLSSSKANFKLSTRKRKKRNKHIHKDKNQIKATFII